MPEWSSQRELQVDSFAFAKLMHALAGLYFWEFAMSLDFDWDLITGKKKFQWPMIFYFLGRYLLFFAMIGILTALDATTKINCQALYTYNQLLGNAAVGLASINLALRTMALWAQNKYIVIPLVLVVFGHWSLILQGVLLKAIWSPTGQGCIITYTDTTILAATFIYSMCFDLIVLLLTAVKLTFFRTHRSHLMNMLFKDGLIYFIIAFVANLIATVFMLLNLNPIMSVIFNVPAAVASTIVASRAVRRLSRWSNASPDVYPTMPQYTNNSPMTFRSGGPTISSKANSAISMPYSGQKTPDGVHVQMDTFTVSEMDADVELNRPNMQTRGTKAFRTLEDPQISAEFKRPPY